MQKLVKGIHNFKVVFSARREEFERLAHGQSPEVLFITCSDSRVVPDLFTQSNPGDLFVIRNAGNVVPAHGAPVGGEAATIEYAVKELKVKDIVICGHTHCGAMTALFNAEARKALPAVDHFLGHCDATRRIIEQNYSHLAGNARVTATVEENVLVQLENLKTHPEVRVALAKGVRLHGWVYKLETGQVYAYDSAAGQFQEVSGPESYHVGNIRAVGGKR
jgi:carbonic anhydrase